MTPTATSNVAVLPPHALMCRFGAVMPRCDSYPSWTRFVAAIGAADVALALRSRGEGRSIGGRAPLAIRLGCPFGDHVRDACEGPRGSAWCPDRSSRYLLALDQEADLAAQALGARQAVSRMHVGAAPLVLGDEQLDRLIQHLRRTFHFDEDAELSIEAAPSRCTSRRLRRLRCAGFNALVVTLDDVGAGSMFHQRPLQSIGSAREAGFARIAVEIACSTPVRDTAAFATTVREVARLRPEAVRLLRGADVARDGAPPLAMSFDRMPLEPEQNAQLLDAYGCLQSCGYVHVGLDEFVLPEDAVAIAHRQGRLQPGIDGLSARPERDVLALGISASGRVGNIWYRNAESLELHCAALKHRRLPVARGFVPSRGDLARRAVINALICQGRVDFESINVSHLIDMRANFAREFALMEPLARAGLVDVDQECLELTPVGRWFAPVVAGLFDLELQRDTVRRRT